MALDNISFSPVDDIHLLRGQSFDLLARLRVGSMTAAAFRTANPPVTYTFTPFFKKTSGTGNQHTGSNITVDTQTGVITTQVAPPAREKRNFLVKAVATLGTESRETHIRIHIHHTIAEAWLSPSPLTVQRGFNGSRFSVRARFDDQVVAEIGDISNGSITTNNNLFTITWSHPISGLVDPATGSINPGALPVGMVSADVTATITAAAIGLTRAATGRIVIADQLSGSRTDIGAELITTGNCPGFSRAHEVPNILFIPDGFSSQDRFYFDLFVNDYVSRLTRGKITAPFDLLSGSINFWKVFINSRERGVTTRSEVYVKDRSGTLVGVPFMNPVKPLRADGTPNDNSSEWHYYHLFYHIGLPVRADKERDILSLRDEWKQTTLLSNAQVDDITNFAIEQWRKTSERRLPEERDTALGLIINDYTAAENDADFQDIAFNTPKRITRTALDRFLANLRDSSGNNVGRFFVRFATPWLVGKDYDNIAFVSATPRAREQNIDGALFIAIREWVDSYQMEDGALTNIKISAKFNNEIQRLPLSKLSTLTHELGHSFGLDDEYGEPPPSYIFQNKFINDPRVSGWPFTRSTDPASLMDWSGNLQARRDLLIPNPNNPGTAILDANKIKWRYHRIEKCGVVAQDISSAGTQYTVTLRQGHANVFRLSDMVFLRKRVHYRQVVGTIGATAVPRQDILRVAPDSMIYEAAMVTGVNAPANQITIRDVDNNTFTITLSVPGAAALFNAGDAADLAKFIRTEPIYSFTRVPPTPPTASTTSDTIAPLISQELRVQSINNSTNQVVVVPTDGNPVNAELLRLATGEVMILYKPMDAPSSVLSPIYKYAEVISKLVLDHLVASPFAFNARPDPAHGNAITEIIDTRAVQESTLPDSLVPSCSSQKKRIVGLYAGGNQHHGDIYHPTGRCFMHTHMQSGSLDEFCIVCKYVLVNIIDPVKHGILNNRYSRKIYPGIPVDLTWIGPLPEL